MKPAIMAMWIPEKSTAAETGTAAGTLAHRQNGKAAQGSLHKPVLADDIMSVL
jgi:hypothetical protein